MSVKLSPRLSRLTQISAALTGLAMVITLVTWFVLSSSSLPPLSSPSLSQVVPQIQVPTQPVPLSEPFADITIPVLRSRTYASTLGSRRLYRSQDTYTSYLTSYTSDDLTIEGLLTIPAGDEPAEGWPAIVFVHGYIAPTEYVTTEKYLSYVDYLARNGFVVFKIDLRGHGDSEGEASGAYYSSDYIIDVLNARAALQASDFVNPSAVGLWGHSMAGNVVLRSMVVQPNIPATVIWAGAVYSYEDWLKYGINDNSYRPPNTTSSRQRRRQELFDTHGQFDASSLFWSQVAPTNYLSDLDGAIALHHAVNDDVVAIGYSRDLAALLDQTDVPHQLYEYPSGGHNIEGTNFAVAMQRTVDFFKEYLK